MDLSDLKPMERFVEIVHPKTDIELGIKVSLLSINDPALKKIKRSILNEKNRLEARGKTFKAEDIEENTKKLIFAAVTGWVWDKNMTFKGDKAPEFNSKNFDEVMKELPWFSLQLEEAISDEKAFF